jgi:type I restriction enzyme S subunit
MVTNWRKTTLGNFVSLQRGHDLTADERRPGHIPVMGSAGMNGYHDTAKSKGPGVVVGRSGASFGQVHYCPVDYWPHNTALYVTDFRGNDARFAYYFLKLLDFSRYNSGSAQPSLNRNFIAPIEICVPEPKEQQAIVAVVGALDDKIELNRRMNVTLEALAQSLFKSWFADATQSASPKGWRYATIAELCEINSWTLGKGDELERIEYVEISEVMRGNIANIQSYERGEEPSRARRRLRHGDTVLSTVRPDRGAYFLCLNPSPNLIGSTGFAVLTQTKAPWSFIHAAMTQPDVFEYLGQQADGGAYPAVRPEIIGALEVPWPNKPELVEEFHRACAPFYERAELNRQESRTLAALRDALLPKLLLGELRVADVEEVVHNPERQTV